LFPKFNKQFKTIFLDIESNNFNTHDNVNIILSPSLYWVKKVSLPVKSIRDAKPLLASIFEDILPSGIYNYDLYKSDDDFFVFAYENKKILELLDAKGLKSSQINHIYFAQSELSNLKGAMKINKTQSIYVKDEIVVLLPCCWIKESGKINLNTLQLSKHHINIQQYTHLIDEKSLYKIVGLSAFFTLLVFVQYILILQNINQFNIKTDNIFSSYSLKPTKMQNLFLLKEYEKIDKKQIALRRYIANILTLNLTDGTKLTMLNSNTKKLIAIFKNVNKSSYKNIKMQLKDMKYSSNLTSNKLTLEFKL